MRYIRYASIAIFAIALILIALANREFVTVQVLPTEIAHLAALNPAYDMPLFLVMFGGVLAGLIIGFIWEWLREHKHRAAASERKAEVRKLERELKKTQAERDKDKDEVLAILDQAS